MKKIYLFIILFFYNHQLFIAKNKFLKNENEPYEQIMGHDYKEKDDEKFQKSEDNNENHSTGKLIFLILIGVVGCGILIYLVHLFISFMKKNNNSSSLQNSSTHLLNPDSNGQQPIIINNNLEDFKNFKFLNIDENILTDKKYKNDFNLLQEIEKINLQLKNVEVNPINFNSLQKLERIYTMLKKNRNNLLFSNFIKDHGFKSIIMFFFKEKLFIKIIDNISQSKVDNNDSNELYEAFNAIIWNFYTKNADQFKNKDYLNGFQKNIINFFFNINTFISINKNKLIDAEEKYLFSTTNDLYGELFEQKQYYKNILCYFKNQEEINNFFFKDEDFKKFFKINCQIIKKIAKL